MKMLFKYIAQPKLAAHSYFMTNWEVSRENVVSEKYKLLSVVCTGICQPHTESLEPQHEVHHFCIRRSFCIATALEDPLVKRAEGEKQNFACVTNCLWQWTRFGYLI